MPKPRTNKYKDLIEALNRRINAQERNIADAERRNDTKQVIAMNIRINESRTIISCIETGRLDHL
jgi:translation initiation factor 2 beta subunit (eIF-2beta)/eIF-5